jgi:hypothetical protein
VDKKRERLAGFVVSSLIGVAQTILEADGDVRIVDALGEDLARVIHDGGVSRLAAIA